MASISGKRRAAADERSGGKIVRGRRIATDRARTPYDRPVPTQAPSPNPSWLTGVIFPTSRKIATGATKLLSSIFGPDTSSSSSSSSGGDSSSDDTIDDKSDNSISFGVDGLKKKNGTTSESMECFRKDPQITMGNSETKRVIEKLLMQETFSREECDRLIKIINSRVMDSSTVEDGQVGRIDIPNLCSKAVMEAKQWFEEKKIASSSKSNLDYGTHALNSVVLSQVTKGELGSPVDMAKSYMQARPPWVSPISYVESRTPSPMGRELLKEGTPYSLDGNSFSSSKKIHSLASGGSWNIQEEIRRVRSKATEDMLKTLPSANVDLTSFTLESSSIKKSLPVDTTESASVLEMTQEQEGSRNEDLKSQPIIPSSVQNQDLEDVQIVDGEEHAPAESLHPTIPDLALENDSRASDRTCSTAKEDTESRGKPNANGFPFTGSSLSAGDVEQKPPPSDDKHPNPVSSSDGKLANSVPMEATCELLSESFVEIPVSNETNSAASGSQKRNSGTHLEGSSQEKSEPNPKQGKTTTAVEKQQVKRVSRYTRKTSAGSRVKG